MGDENPNAPTFVLPPDPRAGAFWHPRLWDVHIFFRASGVPAVTACNPAPGVLVPNGFAASLMTTCLPAFPQSPAAGSTFPSGGFFARALTP